MTESSGDDDDPDNNLASIQLFKDDGHKLALGAKFYEEYM